MSRHTMRRSWVITCVAATAAVGMVAACTPAGAAAGNGALSDPGQPVKGTGVGTKAALAAPNCDATKGTLAFDRGTSVPCVVPFAASADNGGATAIGVTKDSIKVVVYGKSLEQFTASDVAFKPMNLATGETGTIEDMYRDIAAADRAHLRALRAEGRLRLRVPDRHRRGRAARRRRRRGGEEAVRRPRWWSGVRAR